MQGFRFAPKPCSGLISNFKNSLVISDIFKSDPKLFFTKEIKLFSRDEIPLSRWQKGILKCRGITSNPCFLINLAAKMLSRPPEIKAIVFIG